MMESWGLIISFSLTLVIFSYVLEDNPLFKLAINLFIGASAGYIGAVAWYNVVIPQVIQPLLVGSVIERAIAIVPLILSPLLILKISSKTSKAGRYVLAFMVGVGAAVSIGGAIIGTMVPQIRTTIFAFEPGRLLGKNATESILDWTMILIGTISTLTYFHFKTYSKAEGVERRYRMMELFSSIGKGFIAITFGVVFAGVLADALTALVERLHFIWKFVQQFF